MWRREVNTGFGCGNMKEREHFVDIGVDETIILKRIRN
jgi:hypothetical protein